LDELPYVENYPDLLDWLEKHSARCAWQHFDERHQRHSVEGWLVGPALVIVVVHADRHGWELFTASPNAAIGPTFAFADAESRLGVPS
jgi:hypothetical protein